MINYNKYLSIVLPVLCILGWASCSQDRQPCLTPKIASLNVRSVRVATAIDTTAVDTALPSALFVALTATGGKGRIYPTQSTFTISLAPVADSCQWAFTTDTSAALPLFDTFTFYYDRKLQFISNACGYAYFYAINKVRSTHNLVDSFRVTNTNVNNNVNTSHVEVYIHPNF